MAAGPTVALVVVSHSALLARGVVEVAAQMAPDVLIVPAGGTSDGRIGTGFDVVEEALGRALQDGRSAVVLTDLGSAALTAESVLEMAAPDLAARVRIVDAPFVEGAVEAAVVAQTGADLGTVVEAAEDAGRSFPPAPGASGTPGTSASSAVPGRGEDAAPEATQRVPGPTPGAGAVPVTGAAGVSAEAAPRTAGSAVPVRGTAVLRNRLGLHARPAAQLVRTASAFDALVTVNGVDARSVLGLVALGAVGGHELVVAATGPQARQAVTAVVDEIENGFGET